MGSLQVFPVVGKPCIIYKLQGNPIIIMGFQPYSIDIADFPCKVSVIPCIHLQCTLCSLGQSLFNFGQLPLLRQDFVVKVLADPTFNLIRMLYQIKRFITYDPSPIRSIKSGAAYIIVIFLLFIVLKGPSYICHVAPV